MNYNNSLHTFFSKGYTAKYLKDEKLVEAVSLAYYLKTKAEDSNTAPKSSEMKIQDLQMFLSSDLLKMFDASEWMKRIAVYMGKHIAIRKQNDVAIKKKFLALFKDCKFFCSQVYNFVVHKAKLPEIPPSGLLCVNTTGVYIFEEGSFRIPQVSILINDLLEFEQRGPRLKLKYVAGKKNRTVFLEVMASKQLCEDIASSILLALRENRYYVYSYLYISRMLPAGLTANRRSMVEHLHGQRLTKCTENLNVLGDNAVPFNDLPFTSAYKSTIKRSQDSGEGYYYPFKAQDLNRDAVRGINAKKANKPQQSTNMVSALAMSQGLPSTAGVRTPSMNPDRNSMTKRESNVRFEGVNNSDGGSDEASGEDIEIKTKMIDPSLLAISKRAKRR